MLDTPGPGGNARRSITALDQRQVLYVRELAGVELNVAPLSVGTKFSCTRLFIAVTSVRLKGVFTFKATLTKFG